MELQELQDDQSPWQAYNLELVDDMDDTGTENDHKDKLSSSIFEPEDDSLPHLLSLFL